MARDRRKSRNAKSATRPGSGAPKSPTYIKLAVTPQLRKLGQQLAGGAGPPAALTVLDIEGDMTSGDLYVVKVDGIKVAMTNDHGTKAVAPGDHWLTTDLVGDVGSTVSVTAKVSGAQVAGCTCTVVEGSNPPRHADCADDFTV